MCRWLDCDDWPGLPLPEWPAYALGASIDDYEREVGSGLLHDGTPASADKLETSRHRLAQLRMERERRQRLAS